MANEVLKPAICSWKYIWIQTALLNLAADTVESHVDEIKKLRKWEGKNSFAMEGTLRIGQNILL